MQHPNSRPLNNAELIRNFLEITLKNERFRDDHLLKKIRTGEAELANYKESEGTLNMKENRVREHYSDSDRWNLRKQIVNELFSVVRLKKDDFITLGNGGALPSTEVKKDRKAIIVIGLPASGKSGISDIIADEYGAIILDSDYAKRKLPEFKDTPSGASLVHLESDAIIYGTDNEPDDFKPLIELCCDEKINIVLPKIGHSYRSIQDLALTLKNVYDYEVHLLLVSLDKRLATNRAIERFMDSERYVPLSLIFDGYGNEPILSFYRLKDKTYNNADIFKSFGKISTDVKKDTDPIVIYCEDGNPATLFRK